MSFYGKTFKKVKFENVDEFLDAMNAPEKTRALVKNLDATTTFKKNVDGSIQITVSKGGAEVLSHKITPGEESDFITPDGISTKSKFTIKDNALESVLTFPDGKKLNMHRVFEGNSMKHIVWSNDIGFKGITHYEAI